MEEVDVPNSSLVHGEPALSGGVGVGGWASLDDGEGMELDSVTVMAGAGEGARSGVGGLGSGREVSLAGGMVVGVVLSAAAGASARPGVDHPAAERGSVAADPIANRHSGIRRRAKKKR